MSRLVDQWNALWRWLTRAPVPVPPPVEPPRPAQVFYPTHVTGPMEGALPEPLTPGLPDAVVLRPSKFRPKKKRPAKKRVPTKRKVKR